jgi:hypothetical protein
MALEQSTIFIIVSDELVDPGNIENVKKIQAGYNESHQ